MKILIASALVLGTLAAIPTPSQAADGCGPGRWFDGYRCVGRRWAPPPVYRERFYGYRYYGGPPRLYGEYYGRPWRRW